MLCNFTFCVNALVKCNPGHNPIKFKITTYISKSILTIFNIKGFNSVTSVNYRLFLQNSHLFT